MSAKRIEIQQSTLFDLEEPKPYIILENGGVAFQERWNGEPAALIGFQNRFDVMTIDLLFEQWWNDPQSAVGKYPVFVHDPGNTGENGKIFVHQVAIEKVTVFEAGDIDEANTAGQPLGEGLGS